MSNRNSYNSAWYHKNKDRLKPLRKKWARKQYLKRYGLTIKDYDEMLLGQDHKCLICENRPERLFVDHCHKTGRVRGLLCHQCNTGLGMFWENKVFLSNAMRYIDSFSKEG